MSTAVAERLWAKVDKNGPIPEHRPDLGPCWIFMGAKCATGYGHIHFEGRMQSAHRVSYILTYGEIPGRLEPDHLCRVKRCVRPTHLEAVTHRENILRSKGDTCRHGHSLTGANLYTLPSGVRKCRTCYRRNNRAYYHRRKTKGATR